MWDYINSILWERFNEGNPKSFWGDATLKEDGTLFTGSQTKTEIPNTQCVFTNDTPDSDTLLHGPRYSPIESWQISIIGVAKLRAELRNNPRKAAGPNLMTCCFMKELATHFMAILMAMHQQSMDTSAWLTACVTTIFKEGSICLPTNLWPVSLTTASCKLLEHVICSQRMEDHLDGQGILYGHFPTWIKGYVFLKKQRAVTIQDILAIMDHGKRSDLAIPDFNKTFDKRLIGSLRLYDMKGNILT